MGSSSESSGSGSGSSGEARQVQFGVTHMSDESLDDDYYDDIELEHRSRSSSSSSEKSAKVNLMLRHQMPVQQEQKSVAKHLDRVNASICTALLQTALREISVFRDVNKMSKIDVNLEYIPLIEKYMNPEHELEVVLHSSSEKFLDYRKYSRDLCWLESVLNVAILDLQKTRYFEEFIRILANDVMTRQEENTLLTAKKFNQSEVRKLRLYIEEERRELTRAIQQITEQVGNLKDQLNDDITASHIKINYTKQWQKSRHEQNSIILKKREQSFSGVIETLSTEIFKETRVHEEMTDFLAQCLQQYQQDIELWMEKYDKDMEDQEKRLQKMQIQLEKQKEDHGKLTEEYNRRQQAMDEYKEHKLQMQKEAEENERRYKAATRIQSWWRGVMFRRRLGPWRRKKGKEKKGSGKKTGSAKRK